MKRRTHANPMRLLIMLAIMWAAGSLLFAAEKLAPARTTPPAQVQTALQAQDALPTAAQPAGQTEPEESQAAPEAAPETSQDAPQARARTDRTEDEENTTERETTRSGKPETAADAGGTSPRRFVPSEQVRADFDVSFPIDI